MANKNPAGPPPLRFRLLVNTAALTIAVILLTLRVVAFASVASILGNGTWGTPGAWVDWNTYAHAAFRLSHGLGIYAPAQLSGSYQLTHMVLTGYAYPPASVPVFAVVATFPFGLAAWLTLNLGLFFTSLWTLISRAWPRNRALIFALVIVSLAYFGPFLDGVVSANINVGIAGVIGWIAAGASPVWLGTFGALGSITKIFPAVSMLAGTGDKRRSIAMGLGFAAFLIVATLPMVGVASWLDFARAAANAVPDCYVGNSSIACSLGPFIGITAATVVGVLIGGGAGLALLIVRDPFWLSLLATVAMMAPVTNLHPHYWIPALVLLIAGLAKFQAQWNGRHSEEPARSGLRAESQ